MSMKLSNLLIEYRIEGEVETKMYKNRKSHGRYSLSAGILSISLLAIMATPVFSKGIVQSPRQGNDASTTGATITQERNNNIQKPPAVSGGTMQNNSHKNNYVPQPIQPGNAREIPRVNPGRDTGVNTRTEHNKPNISIQPIIIDRNQADRNSGLSERDDRYGNRQNVNPRNDAGWITTPEIVQQYADRQGTPKPNSQGSGARQQYNNGNTGTVSDIQRFREDNRSNRDGRHGSPGVRDDRDRRDSRPYDEHPDWIKTRYNIPSNWERDFPTTAFLPSIFRNPNDPRPQYRKDYENIGGIWKNRYERRVHHYRDHDAKQINFVFGAYSYPYYCYNYRPLYSYPSVYCYYYDVFPPYIYGNRVLFVEPYFHRRNFTHITILMNPRDNYYYSDPARRELDDTLEDIEVAWEEKDIERFTQYVRQGSSIAIFIEDEYAYSLDWRDYVDMTRDAMMNIDTTSFDFDKVVRRQETGEVTAFAKHRFRNWDGSTETIYISYTFERISGNWYITETQTSPYKFW